MGIILLCGQPRSGTSMMMRMLEAGGIEIEYNPNKDSEEKKQYYRNIYGFFETLLPTGKKCFKCLSPRLAKQFKDARLIYIERDSEQILKSWQRTHPTEDRKREKVLWEKENWEDFFKGKTVLRLDYGKTHQNPMETAKQIAEFITEPFNIEEAIKVVDKNLYIKR